MRQLTFTATVTDTSGGYSSYLAPIKENVLAAARDWGQFISSLGRIDIKINIIQTIPGGIANGGSTFAVNNYGSQWLESASRYMIDYGSSTEIRRGSDPNGATSDITININSEYLHSNFGDLWADSNSYDQTHVVPENLTDSLFVFTHEIGHGLGFSGFRDLSTGNLDYSLSTDGLYRSFFSHFDMNVTMSDGKPYFNEYTARLVYGAAIPLTSENLYHYGNLEGAGVNLITGVMTGVGIPTGFQYDVSNLDLYQPP